MSLLTALMPLGSETVSLVERVRRGVVVVLSRHGHGSGVVWDGAKGLIVTNHHVAPRKQATVELADGRQVMADVVARDTDNDLALLRLEVTELSPYRMTSLPICDSHEPMVGELVLAVGHPHGVRGTATMGIISAYGSETWHGGHARRDLLQADIALAPGSSGGPLVNTRGEVVGIASMIMSPRIALAVPSRVVGRFVSQAIAPARERLAASRVLRLPSG